MPLPTIPAGLHISVSGYTSEGPGGVFASEVAGGMPRVAMEWDRGVQPFRGTLLCTAYEFEIWTVFFLHVIKKGAISFRLNLDSGMGVSLHDVTMIPGSYSTVRSPNGVHTVVTFGVWAESQVYAMTPEEVAQILELNEIYGGNLPAVLARLAQLATVDTLVLETP